MKIGLQTISWGAAIEDMSTLCSDASRLGYSGLEIAQRVNTLLPATKLRELLQYHELSLIGLAGGSLSSRIEYAAEFRPDYLYIDEWDHAAISSALAKGLTIGLHPHLYKDIETVTDAEKYLQEYPQIKLILDTAHLYLAGVDVLDALQRHRERIIAVYFKDWMNRYGRLPLRYARGFTALGVGELNDILSKALEYLVEIQFPGWLIVEQDSPCPLPSHGAEISREWLRKHGV